MITVRQRILKASPNRDGYPTVQLARGGVVRTSYVHDLLAEAYLGEKPLGQQVRHLDDDPSNTTLANIAYGTPRQNQLDAVRNGRNRNANKTECKRGHPLAGDNLYVNPQGWRSCRKCARSRDYQRRYPELFSARSCDLARRQSKEVVA